MGSDFFAQIVSAMLASLRKLRCNGTARVAARQRRHDGRSCRAIALSITAGRALGTVFTGVPAFSLSHLILARLPNNRDPVTNNQKPRRGIDK